MARYSRKKPTPNTPPTAMCVELTGSPNADAMITVIAALNAMQNARTGLSLVISPPTVLMSFGPNNNKPMEMPTAPTSITHNGMPALVTISPVSATDTIAANGPTAFATSFAPWANDNSAAEKINGTTNSWLTDLLRFSICAERLAMRARMKPQATV